MLEAIRKRSASILVKLLFALLILSFAAWGIGDMIRGGVENAAVATVGDMEIPPHQLQAEYQREVSRLRQMLGNQVDPEQLRAAGMVNSVLSQLVNRSLFSLGTRDLGLAVSDAVVRRRIETDPTFRNEFNQFDRFRFQQVLAANGMNEGTYVATLRDEIARGHLIDTVTGADTAPKSMLDLLYGRRLQRRVAEVIRFGDEATADPGEPEPHQLAQTHADNAPRFTAPEFRAVTYVSLSAEELAKEVVVSDAELRAEFEQRADEFSQPERRQVRQIVLADEGTAIKGHELLKTGATFEEATTAIQGAGVEPLDLGMLAREEMLPELTNAAFQLPNGGFAPPVKTALGWHLIQVTGIERARRKTVEEARDQLTGVIAREKAVDALFDLANRLEDALGGGRTLEEAGSDLGLTVAKIDALDQQGRDTSDTPVQGLPGGTTFVKTVFETEESEESVLTETGTDGYFILRVDSVTQPELRPLDSVRDAVVMLWKDNARRDASRQVAEAALERVKGGADPAAVAAEAGLKMTVSDPFTRTGTGAPADMAQELIDAVFAVGEGEAAFARGADAYFVARVKDVQVPDSGADPEALGTLRNEVVQSIQNDLAAQYSDSLRKKFPVTVNQRAVDEVY